MAKTPKFVMDGLPGIVTITDFVMAPNGTCYKCFWCNHWEIIIDEDVPIENFKSHEGWFLAAIQAGKVVFTIPGCKLQSWSRSNNPPKAQPSQADCFCFGTTVTV